MKLAGTVIAPTLPSAPGSPVAGQLYYDTSTSTLFWWNGAAWVSASGSAGPQKYLSKPAGTITRSSAAVGSFSTPWTIPGVAVAAGQNVHLRVSAQMLTTGTVGNDALVAIFRGGTQLTARTCVPNASGVFPPLAFEWVDQNPGAGTYTYEVQACQFVGGTLNVYQGNGTTDAVASGGSIFTAEVYGGPAGPMPKITSGTLTAGPPTSPNDGDLWYATAIAAGNVDAGMVWAFRYNAASASAYKWEFVGGSDWAGFVNAFEGTTSLWATVVDLATVGPQYTVIREGDYQFHYTVRARNSAANGGAIAVAVLSSTGVASGMPATATNPTANADDMLAQLDEWGGVVAGNNIRLRYCALASGTASFQQRCLFIRPIRVK